MVMMRTVVVRALKASLLIHHVDAQVASMEGQICPLSRRMQIAAPIRLARTQSGVRSAPPGVISLTSASALAAYFK
jgi:hypothetical protein